MTKTINRNFFKKFYGLMIGALVIGVGLILLLTRPSMVRDDHASTYSPSKLEFYMDSSALEHSKKDFSMILPREGVASYAGKGRPRKTTVTFAR